MGQTSILTGRKAIHLHPRLFAETAIRYLHEKAGGAARALIVRYGSAVNATSSTGISNEPWHYRYVGTTVAKIMKEENLCLEEYLEKYK